MADQEAGEVAGDGTHELYFEDRVMLFLMAPVLPLRKLNPVVLIAIGIWNGIGAHSIWARWVYAQPTWLVVLLVGPIFYLTFFGAIPIILYSCIFPFLLPWRAPAPPEHPVHAIIGHRVRRLRTAIALRSERRATAGAWVRTGDQFVRFGSDAFRGMGRPIIWIDAARNPERTGWTARVLPKLRRGSGE